jgi:hypothetical protein
MTKYRIVEDNGKFTPEFLNVINTEWLNFGFVYKNYSDAVDFLDEITCKKNQIIIHEYNPKNNDN